MASLPESSDRIGLDCISEVSSMNSNFDCSICLELCQEPVVTMCGHLFCWSCLHRWITKHSAFEECPVCKACVKDKVIPLYGRGKSRAINGMGKVKGFDNLNTPCRPSMAQRRHVSSTAPASPVMEYNTTNPRGNYPVRGNTAPMDFSVGFGLFPGLFGFHMINAPEHGHGFESSVAYNGYCRLPAGIDNTTSRYGRVDNLQEFVLFWFLILLALFAMGCFLLF